MQRMTPGALGAAPNGPQLDQHGQIVAFATPNVVRTEPRRIAAAEVIAFFESMRILLLQGLSRTELRTSPKTDQEKQPLEESLKLARGVTRKS